MKKNTILLALVATTLFAFKSVVPMNWTVDKAHSKLGFEITHLMVSDVEGSFKNFDSKITTSKEDFSDAVVELSAEVASVNTDNDQRDKHLVSADFFDAEKYPTLTFKSTSVKKVSAKNYKINGNLTFHGVTKPITLDGTLRGVITNPQSKKTIAGFKVSGTIKRSDYNFGAKYPNAMLSDEVVLNANTEFVKQ